MALARISEYQPRWPEEYAAIQQHLTALLGPTALRIDHIGSTSVPGLAAKDIIDVQVTVADLDDPRLHSALAAGGYRYYPDNTTDHVPAGAPDDPREWAKRYYREPEGQRLVHIHIRAPGRHNQRYALLFRDYLRAHPAEAAHYATFKRRLAALDIETGVYAEIKDPVCDLILTAATHWAATIAGPGSTTT